MAIALLELDEELDDGAADADEGAVVVEAAADAEALVLAEAGGAPLGDEALAVAWNVAKLLFAVGLMAKTIPLSQ